MGLDLTVEYNQLVLRNDDRFNSYNATSLILQVEAPSWRA